jgi:acetyl-CoA carboxylase biotin carboxyl carrier protein
MAERNLTYDDLVQIVELIKRASQFAEFRLKVGDIEVSLKRANGVAQPAPIPQDAQAQETPAVSRKKPVSFSDNLNLVRSPMVGTFYRAPAPGQPPFVEPDSILCIIEVMKLMNSIEAGVRGVVREILVANAAAVEYGEALVVIEPRP